jgi:predicted nucleotidyltransferase
MNGADTCAGLSPEALDGLTARLAGETRILAAYLLGSAARGDMRADSDVDVALLPEPGVRLAAAFLADLGGELTAVARRPVDLGVVTPDNLVYARQAVFAGRRLFCRDRVRADLAEADLLGMAAQFDYERREVAHAYSVSAR